MSAVAPVLDHEKHAYTLAGKPLISVSKVIDAVMKKSFDGVDPEILRNAAERGTLTEQYATEWLKTGGVSVPPNERQDVLDRLECFERFMTHKKPELVAAQKIVWSDIDGVAGMLDFLLRIDGDVCLVDMKCTSQAEPSWCLQVGAYSRMVDVAHQRCAVLHVNPKYKDGYIWREYDPLEIGGQWQAALRWYRVLQQLKAA